MYFTEPSPYLESAYYGKFASYPKNRFRNEDELYITAVSMIAGILRLDETGFTKNRDVTKRITVSCRQASVLFSVILKAKGIPCGSRAGFLWILEMRVTAIWSIGLTNTGILMKTDGFW